MSRDILYGLRSLVRRPWSSVAAIVTLAVGIGLNAAVFSVADWVLFRPLPYPSPHELVRVFTAATTTLSQPADLSYSEFEALARASSFRASSAFSTATRVMRGQGIDPAHIVVARVAGDLFGTLGVYPALGRGFGQDEATAGAPIVVLSEARWRNGFAGDPAVVGRVITIDGQAHTVIGVMPARRGYPADADLWRPLTASEREDDDRELVMMTRLVSGGTADRASVELSTLARAASGGERTAWAEDIQRTGVRDVRAALAALLGSAALVLLMACANVAALIGARSADRDGEMAVRGALGASRARLVGQLLTESLILAAAGGSAGLLLGQWALGLLVSLAPAAVPRLAEVALDWRIILAGIATTFVVGLAVGLSPAVAASRLDLRGSLSRRGSARASSPGVSRRVLVTAQVAIAIVLSVGAALLARSLQHLVTTDHGFTPEGLVAVDLYLRDGGGGDVRQLYRTLVESAEAVPGIRSAAVTLTLPTRVAGLRAPIRVEGAAETRFTVTLRPVTPGYFETVGIRLTDGRVLTANDRQNTPRVAVVNAAFVRDVVTGRRAIGTRVSTELLEGTVSVVGVVADVTPAGEADRPALYLSADQFAVAGGYLIVRTDGVPRSVVPALTTRLRTAAPALALDKIQGVADTLEAGRSITRFNLQLAAAFAVLALLLAAIGVYGLTAGEVTARWRELAVRLALGAPRHVAFWTVLQPAAAALAAGGVAGLAVTLGVGRWIAALLHGVEPHDSLTLLLVPLVLGTVGLLAASLAAARILRADPAATLRRE